MASKRVATGCMSAGQKRRFYIVMVCLLCGFGFATRAAFSIQVTQHDELSERAAAQHNTTVKTQAPRGRILDRRGRVLAITGVGKSIVARPHKVKDITHTAQSLVELLGIDRRQVEYRLSNGNYFAWIGRHVEEALAKQVEEAQIPGIEVIDEPRRYYPYGNLAAHIVGFSNIDGEGLAGVEKIRNNELSGTAKILRAIRDSRGRKVLPVYDERQTAGHDVSLTIDAMVQEIAESNLEEAVLLNKAKSGSVVVIDVETSEVLAMASYPTYDPNGDKSDHSATRNRAISDVFEIGSVMKPIVMAGALERKVVSHGEVFSTHNGRYTYYGKTFRDTFRDTELTPRGAIKRSSNIVMVQIAERLGVDHMVSILQDFGFGQEVGIGLIGESSGMTRPKDKMGHLDLATAAFGYGGTMATPLQVAAAIVAVVNGGVYRQPKLFKNQSEDSARRVLRPEVSALMRDYLSSVFEKGKHRGSASGVEVPGYHAGGKTGTARKVDPRTGKYADDKHIASFVGAAPIEQPKIVVAVVIDEPSGEQYYGGKVAGPAFGKIVSESLRYLQVLNPNDDLEDEPILQTAASRDKDTDETDVAIAEPGKPVLCGDVDFSAMPLNVALEVARENGLRVRTRGIGRVAGIVETRLGCDLILTASPAAQSKL